MSNVLWGVVCLDHYTATDQLLPGCGILHNAYHLQQLGAAPLLVTRLGSDDSAVIEQFLSRHHIAVHPDHLLTQGACARIEVAVNASGAARVFDFTPGVWADYRLTPAQELCLAAAQHLHIVLTAPVIGEFRRLCAQNALSHPLVSADFLALYDFNAVSFAEAVHCVDVAFVGWQGALEAPLLQELVSAAQAAGALGIFTLGERGVLVCEPGCAPRLDHIEAVSVAGSTNGCGDAFISYFLAEYWRSRDLALALEQGKYGGALATTWRYALPDEAYGRASGD
ncbi:MAG: carbohydrate kinase family protein [Caldilinea sp.]